MSKSKKGKIDRKKSKDVFCRIDNMAEKKADEYYKRTGDCGGYNAFFINIHKEIATEFGYDV